MELEKNDITNVIELSTLRINKEIFEQIKNKIIDALNKIGISNTDMSIYYERHSNGTSILAIKLSPGNDSDMNNYMINGCMVEYRNNNLSCDIGFHANAKVGQNAMKIANMINQDIILFFEKIEKDFFDKDLTDIELSIRILLGTQIEKTSSSKKNNIRTKIRSLLKR